MTRRRASQRFMPYLGQVPLLVSAAVTGPQNELGAVGGVEAGVVEALAGGRVDQLTVAGLPLLVGPTVAVPQLDEGAVVVVGAGDVQALAEDGQGAAGRRSSSAGGLPWQSHIWILLPLAVLPCCRPRTWRC